MAELPAVTTTLSESRDNAIPLNHCYYQDCVSSDLEALLVKTTDSKEESMLFGVFLSRHKIMLPSPMEN